jgi:hypothetical protein
MHVKAIVWKTLLSLLATATFSTGAFGADPPLTLLADDGTAVGGPFNCCDAFGECELKRDMDECGLWGMSDGHFSAATGVVVDESEAVGDIVGSCGVGRNAQIADGAQLVRVAECESVDPSMTATSVSCLVTPILECGQEGSDEVVGWPTFALTSYVDAVPTSSIDPDPGAFDWIVVGDNGDVVSAQQGRDPCVQ